MLFSLEGKVAVVTGGAQGIGRAICLAMAKQGADVSILDINIEQANNVKKEIEEFGRKAVAYQVDVCEMVEVKAAANKTVDELGKIDIWVNNVGWDKMEPFVNNTEDLWDKIIAINLRGVINGCRVALDSMLEKGAGKIINISSDAGRVGSSGEAVYSAAKGGVISFTKSLARETARSGINVNCICPGPNETPFFAKVAEENPKISSALAKAIPWGRLGQPEEPAYAVVFFASDEASYITGQTLSVSGGLTMS